MNKSFVRIWFGVLTLFSLNACRSGNVVVAEPQVEMPEVAGRPSDIAVRAGLQPARSVRAARFPDHRPPDMRLRTEDTAQEIINLGVDVGVGERFEVGAFGGSGSFESACAGVVVKYQAHGPTRAQAVAGDWAAGFAAHGTGCRADLEGNSTGTMGDGGYPWKDSSTSRSFDVGTSVSYHLADRFALYGGFALGVTHAEAVVNQDRLAGGLDAGGVYSAHVSGEAQSVALGFNWGGSSTWLNMRANFAHSNSDYINPDHFGLGANLGVRY